MDRTVIEVDRLGKSYRTGFLRRSVTALDDVSFEVRAGEIFGFLGPNGAGKTTTIRILLGFVRQSAGTASVLGREPRDPATRRRVGFMPEQPYFYEYLTGAELLAYMAQLHGLAPSERDRRAAPLLEELDIAHAMNLPLRKYSKGMLQRIGLVQALVNDPELVILDEPMSGLDPMGRKQVRDLILRLRREGRTVFFSSHILSDVEMISDRVAMLARGRLVGVGTVDELLAGREERVELCAVGLGPDVAERVAAMAAAHMVRGDQHLFTIDSRERADAAIQALAGKGRILSVASHRGTLEELFVERVGEARGEGVGR